MKLIVAIDNYSKGIGYKNKLVLKLDSDLKEFYVPNNGGAVISAAINKYMYIKFNID